MAPSPSPGDIGARYSLSGFIGSSGFASGDRIVVGHWLASPMGPITDVMWARPDGTRVLLAPNELAAAFIGAVYEFDEVEVTAIAGHVDRDMLRVSSPQLDLTMRPGRRLPLPGKLLPAALWRLAAAPIARAAFGVNVHGHSPTGVEEWYRARSWAPLRDAVATAGGRSLGPMADVEPRLGVGFSEPPARPSLVGVTPLLQDHGGRVAAALT